MSLASPWRAWACAAAWATALSLPTLSVQAQVAEVEVVGDAIPRALAGLQGDPVRGRLLVTDRRTGLCLLCHRGPFAEEAFQGDLSTSLAGAGSRWTAGQLRLRLVDARRLNPDTVMPAYHRIEGLQQVGRAWQGKPLFSAQQVEDVVAFLVTLQ